MRPYPSNSAHAAARIVALALIADGDAKPVEFNALARMNAYDRLGIEPAALRGVLHELCTDMLAAATGSGESDCRLAPEVIGTLLAEVDDPRMRRLVFELCSGVARADRKMHDGELIVLMEAIERWRVGRDPLTAAPAAAG